MSRTIFLDETRTSQLRPWSGIAVPPVPLIAETEIRNDVNRNNFGLTGGAGFLIPSGKKNNFIVDFRVSRGVAGDTKRYGNEWKQPNG